MPNSEPVYAYTKAASANRFDPSAINSVLSRNNPLDTSLTDDSPVLKLMRLRHFLIEKVNEEPHSKIELKQLQAIVSQRLSEDLWDKEDRAELIDICKREWKSKLRDESVQLAVQSFKHKLNQIVPTGALVDLGFSFAQHSKRAMSLEDFMLDQVALILKNSLIDQLSIKLSFYMIRNEYQGILSISEL